MKAHVRALFCDDLRGFPKPIAEVLQLSLCHNYGQAIESYGIQVLYMVQAIVNVIPQE